MSVRAYILIESKPGSNKFVLDHVRALPGIKLADRVTGPYDVIAVLESESLAILSQMTVSKIHTIEGVVRTLTCVATTPPA
jgi:DNA-binding Lrp family transcriptional regulator